MASPPHPPRQLSPDVRAAGCIIVVAAVYVAGVLGLRTALEVGPPSPDIYGAQYPMLAYFSRSILRGHGFLWNGLQNCGEPTIPATPPGTLYPLNLLFVLTGLGHGYPVMAALHLAIGGLGLYLLCREYELPVTAALAGAFAFELGAPAIHLATWLPTANLGAYVWMPLAMLLLERILRAPTLALVVQLTFTLVLSLLAGCPQVTFFIYQVLVLRVLWQAVTPGGRLRPRTVAALAVALGLPMLIGAVQLLPSLEFARASVRPYALTVREMEPGPIIEPWQRFRTGLQWRGVPLFTVAPVTLAVLAWCLPGRRTTATFYGLVAAIYLALMLQTPLFDVYQALPLGRLFRLSSRFYWPAWFATCVLVALGVGALAAGRAPPGRDAARGVGLILPALVATSGLAFLWLVHSPPWPEPVMLAALVVLALRISRYRSPRFSRPVWATRILFISLFLAASAGVYLRFLPNGAVLTARRDAFDLVRALMTPQDRAFIHTPESDLSLMQKSGTVFGVPVIGDYDPQTPRRFAALWVRMVLRSRLEKIDQYNLSSMQAAHEPPLLNLMNARFLVLSDTAPNPEVWMPRGSVLLSTAAASRVYLNPNALPRAYFVPRLEVITDPDALLERLASPGHRPREVALIEEPPADGFLGSAPGSVPVATGTVSLEDLSELVTLSVSATGPGFVVLTDQYYPGWEADVNGQPAVITRANYAFRAVRVPAGASLVRFRYRPWTVYLGAAITAATLLVILAAGAVIRWRRRHAGTRVADQLAHPSRYVARRR